MNNFSFKNGTFEKIEPLLQNVEKPSRYLGCEWNSPDIQKGGVSVVFAYPDIYEIGIGNIGLQILQEIVNGMEGASAERVYCPWVDMEEEMRSASMPLFSLETHRPVSTFDILGISIPHELLYTNILNLIHLAGLPLRVSERNSGPIVIGGGCAASNPEPLFCFFDLIVLGEAEDIIREIVDVVARGKLLGWAREKIIEELSTLEGIYRPSIYDVDYTDDGRIGEIRSKSGRNQSVKKRVVDIETSLYPSRPIVSLCEAVHDRVNVELFRGCTRGCRFCHAGMIYRPVRDRSGERVVELAKKVLASTGHEEISLCSLSSTDYPELEYVLENLSEFLEENNTSITLPSLRMDGYSVEITSKSKHFSNANFTFAPEAGTERLRKVINKPLSEKDMIDTIAAAAMCGTRRIKLYFMIGLPTETEDDVIEIAKLTYRLRDAVRARGFAPPSFNISVSTFVPKPHTPFQWSAQEGIASIERKQKILVQNLRSKAVNLSWHDKEMSTIESILARGDRRLHRVIEVAWRKGAKFDAWSENFDFSRWEEAFGEAGLDMEFYLTRERLRDEIFPWDHLDYGL
ncbi:MAG: TIGR03960 family B12-binding radical SAM protein, partial [Actinomycetota bacterium]|nr:TIGR03960 family B12-binding radical SAM protein [Actinomycetota bacterium]